MQRKGPLPGKIFTRCILRRRFAGHFGCMARISCQSQLISDAWRANLAANWRFSRPRPLSGCMERKTCHGLTPGNASGRNLATARLPGTHRASILPLPVRPRAHQGAILPPPDAGGVLREHSAIVERLGTYQGIILPRPDARAERSARPCATAPARLTSVAPSAPPFVYATRHPDAAELRVLQAVRALVVAQPADCRVAAERVVNIAKLVSVPQRRSARRHALRCHAPQRHNAMRCNIA